MAIIEPSARMASDVRIDARRACPPGAPERTMEGKARGRRVGAIRTFIGGRFPGWVLFSVLVLGRGRRRGRRGGRAGCVRPADSVRAARSDEQPSDLQSLMRISYAVFCLKKKIA